MGIENMEIAFTPGCILWNFRIKSFPLQKCPECIYIGDVEDDPAPLRHAVALLQVKDRRF